MSQHTRARTTGAARKPRKDTPTIPLDHGADTHSALKTSPTSPLSARETAAGVASGDVEAEKAERAAVGSELRSPFAPETLARTLRAVAAALERDPALARRVADAVATEEASSERTGKESGAAETQSPEASPPPDQSMPPPSRLNRSFRPRLVTGAGSDLGTGIPNPFALRETLGADGLRTALTELRLGTLRAIVREHGLDPKGVLSRQNDAEKLRAAILAAARV